MKKFLALLLMALLLIPALAMADIPKSIPPEQFPDYASGNTMIFGFQRGLGDSYLTVFGSEANGHYSAYYTLDGVLSHYYYLFSDGCSHTFTRDGAPFVGSIFRNRGFAWNESTETWIKEDPNASDEDKPTHNPVAEHRVPYSYPTLESKYPPENAVDAAHFHGDFTALKNLALHTFPELYTDVQPSHYTYIIKSSNPGGNHVLLYKEDAVVGKICAAYDNDGKLYEVYVGNVVFNTVRDGNRCLFVKDTDYGPNLIAEYDWDTGLLTDFRIQSADKMFVAGYTVQNVLSTCEYTQLIDGRQDRWEFGFNGGWEHNGKPEQPSEAFLKSLTIPGIANYRTPVASSESSLSEEERKAAHVIAGSDAFSDPNATVKVGAEKLDNENGSVYNIEIVSAGTDNNVTLTQPVTLYLPYPNGMTQNASDDYGFAIIHTKDNRTEEIMSSEDGGIQPSGNGLQVTATSFSPYKVIWGTKAEIAANYKTNVPTTTTTPAAPNLPQTGDTSNLALYAVLLTLSIGALAVVLVMSKRRASR